MVAFCLRISMILMKTACGDGKAMGMRSGEFSGEGLYIPRLSKAGWLRHQSMGPFLSGADGAVSNSINKKVRCAVRY
jgi:hypothetical protein